MNRRVTLTIAAVLAIAGCAGETEAGAPPVTGAPTDSPSPTQPAEPSSPATPSAPASPADDEPVVASWTDDVTVTLGDWTVGRCDEGDAPLLCVRDGDQILGDLALHSFPMEPALEWVSLERAAQEQAETFVESFTSDRAEGCGDFTFTADPVRPTVVGGHPGSTTGFTLTDDDGRVVERVLVSITAYDGHYWLVQTDAYVADGGCLPPSETDRSFAPEDLADVEPFLAAVIAGTPLPETGAPSAG